MTPIVTLLYGDSTALMNDPPDGIALTPKQGRVFKVDAVVTDPPYGFDFAGEKDWDTFEDNRSHTTAQQDSEQFALFTERWVRAACRLTWPGAHIVAFTADRTLDLLGRGMRLANLEIVRSFFWLYASGQVKNPNDTRPGCEPMYVGRFFGEMGNLGDLKKLFKEKGRGQLNAQAWKEEDGKHPTNVMIDQSLVDNYEDVAAIIAAHPGTFFVPKPSPKDRDWGCADLPLQKKDNRLSHMTSNYTGKVVKNVMAQNVHPTVKSIELMRRIIRGVSRPGHVILDPFLGSGTTGIAAVMEGRHFIGIERDPDYFRIAHTRISSALVEAGGEPLAPIDDKPEEVTTL